MNKEEFLKEVLTKGISPKRNDSFFSGKIHHFNMIKEKKRKETINKIRRLLEKEFDTKEIMSDESIKED